MTDEQQIRSLLTLAAEPPDDIEPPVSSLLERGRRERKLRAILSVLSVAVIAAAAFGLPPIVRALAPGQTSPAQPTVPPGLFPAHPGRPGSGPSAAQLSRFRWSALPPSPIGPRSQPVLAWTGKELLELGGVKNGSTASDGAAFDPATGRWRTIAPVRANVGFSDAVDVWTGRQLFIANGQNGSCAGGVPVARCLPRAGLYDPATNQWTTTLLPKQLDGLALGAAAWTGRDVVLAGVSAAHARLRIGAYDPATSHWHMITPTLPASHPPVALAMVATSSRVLLWSLWSKTTKHSATAYSVASGIDVLSLGRSGWTTVTGHWPQHQTVDSPDFAGGAILLSPSQIWCGLCSHPGFENTARLADAGSLRLQSVPAGPLVAHQGLEPPIWLWNGASALAANSAGSGAAAPAGRLGRMAAWDPPSQRWFSLPSAPGRPPMAASPVWAGRELLLLTASGGLLSFHG